MKFVNGDIYEGSWLNDVFNGFGVYRYRNDNVYEGSIYLTIYLSYYLSFSL
jgi:hypothetical protein